MAEMKNADLIAACDRKVQDSAAFGKTQLNADRKETMDYYLGNPFGNEQEGRSQVVTRDVAEAVDSLLPDLIEVFVSSENPVVFLPVGKEDIAGARQATDYVNQIWRQHGGIELLHNWLKDGLLHKRGVVKVYWEDREWKVPENYEGLTYQQLISLATDKDLELEEITPRDKGGPTGDVDETGQPVMLPPTFDVKASRTNRDGYVCYKPIPLDEFLIDRNAVSDQEAPFIGHRSKKSRSELIEMGIPKATVANLTGGSDNVDDLTSERIQRFQDEGGGSGLPREPADESTEELWFNEVFIRIDFDGDGKAELRRVQYVGDYVHANDAVDDHDFATWGPLPLPHKFWGQSIADQAKDIQLIKSTIVRQMLDNLYLANNPEKAVVEGAVNMEDLLVSRPGGIKRMRMPNAIENFEYPFVAGQSFPMVEWLDQTLERRTGAMRQNQGLDPDAINKTATGMQKLMSAGQRRERLIARLFAETGLTRLFKLTLKNVVKYQRIAKIVELRGEWVEMDPRNWRTDRDTRVNVGLGTESREQTIGSLMAMLQIDAQLIQFQGGLAGPILNATNLYNKLAKLVEAAGLKTPALYYSEPPESANQPQPPKPDPEMVKVQGELQIKQKESDTKLQTAAAKAQMDAQIASEKARFEAQLALMKANLDAQIALFKARQEMKVEGQELLMEAALKKYQIDVQAEVDKHVGITTNLRDPSNKKKDQ